MAMYRCSKCGVSAHDVGGQKPLSGGCRSGGNHRWSKTSDGFVKWRCSKCGNTAMANARPMNAPCRCGGNHSWAKS